MYWRTLIKEPYSKNFALHLAAHHSISADYFCKDPWKFACFGTFGGKWGCLNMKKSCKIVYIATYWPTLLRGPFDGDDSLGPLRLLVCSEPFCTAYYHFFIGKTVRFFLIKVLQNLNEQSFPVQLSMVEVTVITVKKWGNFPLKFVLLKLFYLGPVWTGKNVLYDII